MHLRESRTSKFSGLRQIYPPVTLKYPLVQKLIETPGIVIYHSVRAVTKKAVRNRTMNCLTTTHGVAICEMFMWTILKKTRGQQIFFPQKQRQIDFSINLLFPEDLIELIVNETNLNAEQKQRAAGRQDQNWTPVNGTDIRAYFGIRILQGIKTLPSEQHFWSRNKYLHVKKVSDSMTRNRYLKINEYLHFNDATTAVPQGHKGHDKLHQIRPLIERLTETFSAEYKPNKENAIDEGLIKFKGRLGFRQYMPQTSKARN